jgi:Pumilio-family RNA binding repeat
MNFISTLSTSCKISLGCVGCLCQLLSSYCDSFALQNYVVQYVLEYGKQHDRALVISKLRGQMLHMSRHKFASNVCEKALLTADPESRRALIQEMMTSKQDGASNIATMMKDQYASKLSLTIL